MVLDRIQDRAQVTQREDPWKISATKETKEEKKRQQDQGSGQQDHFGENTDFTQMITKDPRHFQQKQIPAAQIKNFTFRGISTHRELATLEVDIRLSDGSLIKGAQLAISRQEGMKYLSRKPGEGILVEPLIRGSLLTVAIPQKIPMRPSPESERDAPLSELVPTGKEAGLAWYYYLGLGVILLASAGMFYLFFLT